MDRSQTIDAFLADTDWQSATREPLKQDASFRHYYRLHQAEKTVMLMDAPPPEKSVSLFADIARFLRQHGIYAPEIVALDESSGLMLLEDMGDDTFSRILANQPQAQIRLYEMAIKTLRKLHKIDSSAELKLGTYNTHTLIEEAQLFTQWFYPAVSGKLATTQQSEQFNHAWQQCIDALPAHQQVLVLRDYHVDNLMQLSDIDQKIQCGVLDFQDALIGSPAYDLVSLLEDARRDISPELKTHCLDQYFSTMAEYPGFPDRATLTPWMNVLGAQRHAKVLGIFVRLYKRDQKTHYLKHLPRVISLFEASLAREPLLDPVTHWMTDNLPFHDINLNTLLENA